MKTEDINTAMRRLRDALEHVQQARQLVMESKGSQWPKTVIARAMTDGGKFLLDAERELGRMHEWRQAHDEDMEERALP